ncbi:MAG: DUF1684 domain-containing protein [Trueperaceae bacterium]|nr:DUF1684 domain-containing protein [Trueperaceae bacterium]
MPHDPTRDGAAELDAWRRAYAARLAGPRGAWSITSLSWLTEAPLTLGRDGDVPLPGRCPARVATLSLVGEAVRVAPHARLWLDGQPLAAARDVDPADATLRLGPEDDAVEVVLLRRGERVGARVFDPRQGAGRPTHDLAWYPVTAGWVADAVLEPADPGATLPVVNVLGDVTEAPVAGTLRFTLRDAPYALVALAAGPNWFVNFRDATSGHTTYGAGRFLQVPATADDRTRLDFHRAHHPPCAHTPHATCPLPPLANRLPLAVRAGERLPGA